MIFKIYWMLFFFRYVKENGGIDIEVGYLYLCYKSCCYDKVYVGVICIGE